LASRPQQSRHFAEYANSAVVDGGAMDNMFDKMAETLIVRPILHHKRCKADLGIGRNIFGN
jgi:hypothetical protein